MNDYPHPGFAALLKRPLIDTMARRRTHRVSRGVPLVQAGSMSYRSDQKPEPLGALEEAVLIAATGHTGLTMPDRPFQDPATGVPIMSKPNLTMDGRTAGSPDNSQGTHFFMLNDSGTYYIRRLPSPEPGAALTPELLVERADQAKLRVLDRRLDVPDVRDFPAYLDSNRFLSNLPGTTVFFPVVDLSHQYINGLMYLLTQPDGARPTIVDDRNFYQAAGVKKWVQKGFLNKDLKVPLGVIGSLRTQIEADLLLQKPHADRGSHGPRRLDPRQHQSARRPRRSEVHGAIRPDARLRLRDAALSPARCSALAGAAAEIRQPPRSPDRAESGKRAGHQGQVPALLSLDVGGGRRGDRRQVRTERDLRR